MTVESASFISQLNGTLPLSGDPKSEGDNHLRLIKAVLLNQFPNLGAAAVAATAAQLSALTRQTGYRAKNVNGNFDIWQRGTSLGSGSGVRYLADAWYNDSVGSSYVPSRQAFALGQTAVPNEPSFYHRTVVTSVAGAANYTRLSTSIESVRTWAGGPVVTGLWMKADTTRNVAVEYEQFFGTGGSPSATVSAGVVTCALTTTWQFFPIAVTLPSISGKTLGSNGNDRLTVNIWFEAGSGFNSRTNSLGQQSGTFDVAQVQVESGVAPTPYEIWKPEDRIAAALRRYEVFSNSIIFACVGATILVGGALRFAIPKRSSLPFVTVTSSSTTQPYGIATSSFGASAVNDREAILVGSGAGSLIRGDAYQVICGGTIDAELV